ncbi:hypothetical protein [Actinomycetospora chibensis]|uniref:Cardiolipin synthase N-terminal domain-containing protein n=1 Tax=Actinomycetospora chibensis TaxID=663606 RepID=A0ABV9RGM8_9PSEU|nr:hypothetical protein [Actinomycetospora chibensis]MDD7926727.1 hypothetical protein [Actinomycetospora chibensis]
MKKLAELLVCFLHPIAVILVWLNLVVRPELSATAKIVWAVLALVPIVPFVYVLTGGELWEGKPKAGPAAVGPGGARRR